MSPLDARLVKLERTPTRRPLACPSPAALTLEEEITSLANMLAVLERSELLEPVALAHAEAEIERLEETPLDGVAMDPDGDRARRHEASAWRQWLHGPRWAAAVRGNLDLEGEVAACGAAD